MSWRIARQINYEVLWRGGSLQLRIVPCACPRENRSTYPFRRAKPAMQMPVMASVTAPRRREQIFAAQHDEADMGSLGSDCPCGPACCRGKGLAA